MHRDTIPSEIQLKFKYAAVAVSSLYLGPINEEQRAALDPFLDNKGTMGVGGSV